LLPEPNEVNASANSNEPQSSGQPDDGNAINPSIAEPLDSPPYSIPEPTQPQTSGMPPIENKDNWWNDRKFVLELLGFAVLTAYTVFSCLQWLQIRWTNNLTQQALSRADQNAQDSSKQFQVQLGRYDANLGVSQIMAGQAITQAQQTTKISADTHDLAVAAQHQSIASTTIANEATVQAKATDDLAKQATRSADLSDKANAQAAAFFTRQNRPWVGFEQDLNIDSNGIEGVGHVLRTSYKEKNFGNAPALNAILGLEIIPDNNGNIYAETKAAVQRQCDASDRILTNYSTGDTLLPQSTRPSTWAFGQHDDFPKHIIVAGCIAYRDESKIVHHTQLCYWVHFGEKIKADQLGSCWFQSAD
jgi:hypothetical protein